MRSPSTRRPRAASPPAPRPRTRGGELLEDGRRLPRLEQQQGRRLSGSCAVASSSPLASHRLEVERPDIDHADRRQAGQRRAAASRPSRLEHLEHRTQLVEIVRTSRPAPRRTLAARGAAVGSNSNVKRRSPARKASSAMPPACPARASGRRLSRGCAADRQPAPCASGLRRRSAGRLLLRSVRSPIQTSASKKPTWS